jgi:hypothetical protein
MESRIAFLVLAHSDPPLLHRLCRALGADTDIFVHFDRKAHASALAAATIPDNVHFIEPPIAVHWADISVVDATLALIEQALQTGREYVRLVLISGSCYPIRKVTTLRAYFAARPGHNEIRYFNLLESPADLKHVVRFHLRLQRFLGAPEARYPALLHDIIRRSASLRLPLYRRELRTAFPGMRPHFGSQWWALTPECARFILRFVADNPAYRRFFQSSFAPDETFFHTIVGNSRFSAMSDGCIPFAGRGKTDLGNLHIISSNLKKIYTLSDLPEISASSKFFVRKVSSKHSGGLLDYLDRRVLT